MGSQEPKSPALQADSLPSESSGKPKNTGVGSLSSLQGIFPTQVMGQGSPVLQVDSLPAELPGKRRSDSDGGSENCSSYPTPTPIHCPE